ncbi:spore germination protein [Paenibacillus aquistagni]|uniref:spore germination protein n=1 Tax=Paenibacillus aquistagni TaxID=1852522 RepID=UPI00145B71CA|nr:spore germination protein [Paenibacillus aquistagni]NMM52768.1 spore germination protein [Paenibacillus aquistagni]
MIKSKEASHYESALRKWFGSSTDIQFVEINLTCFNQITYPVLIIYCKDLCDSATVHQFIIPLLKKTAEECSLETTADIKQHIPFYLDHIDAKDLEDNAVSAVLTGNVLLYFKHLNKAFFFPLDKPPTRNTEEPNTEVSNRGPRDGFTEEVSTNIALVRKRLRVKNLTVENYRVGANNTKVSLIYVDNEIKPEVLNEIKTKLDQLNVKMLISSTQLEELLGKFSLFPLFTYTGRPDFTADALMKGKFALLVEGSPTAIIAPVTLNFVLNSAEDAHMLNIFVVFNRLIRLSAMMISIFLPGFWITLLTFHQDQLPFTLLATLVTSRQGVPLPVPLEALVMLLLFEIFREAGMRLPSAFGQTLSVVGGLIIGQAAISAGLSAPGIIVIIAISVLAAFTISNQSLLGIISIIRMVVLIISGFLGLFGFFICLLSLVMYLVNIHSFGTYYLSPFSPASLRNLKKAFVRYPWGKKD